MYGQTNAAVCNREELNVAILMSALLAPIAIVAFSLAYLRRPNSAGSVVS